MFKKVLTAGLAAAIVLCAAACGEDSGASSSDEENIPEGSSIVDSKPEETMPPAESEPQESGEETPQPTEEPSTEELASFIFSVMPIAAYEVTGLGVGLNEEVYQENIIDTEEDYDLGVVPLVRLDPSHTFVLFCLPGESEVHYSTATVSSSSNGGQWQANEYTCLDYTVPEIEGYTCGSPCLTRGDTFDEGTYGGSFESLIDPWTFYIRFSELYHPDAAPEDAIHVIEIAPFAEVESYDEPGEIMAELVQILEMIGATEVKEIPVEEALERYNVIVSE